MEAIMTLCGPEEELLVLQVKGEMKRNADGA